MKEFLRKLFLPTKNSIREVMFFLAVASLLGLILLTLEAFGLLVLASD